MMTTLDVPQDGSQEVVVPVAPLKALVIALLIRKGMFEVEATIAADRMIEADLRGIHSHGTRCLKKYLAAIDTGDIDPRALMMTAVETPAIAVLEANAGMGHVSATRAMELAIKKAREIGTGTVVVKKGQHFGAAACYVMMAIREGMIGYCTTGTGTVSVAAYGSQQAGGANHALAWGIPTASGFPYILDMAVAESSWGKIETMGIYGLPIPLGWALDETGHETTDAKAAKVLLPTAGARGSALGFVCAAVTAGLVGRKTPIHKPKNAFGPGSDHFFYVIDPTHFGAKDRFLAEMDSTINDIRALAPVEGFDRVRVAGELEWERTQKWLAEGLPLHRDHVAGLTELSVTLKIAQPAGWPG